MMEVLKQPQYSPVSVEHQVIILFAVGRKHLLDIDVSRIKLFEKELIDYIDNNYPEIVEDIKNTKDLSDENIERIEKAIEEFKKNF